MKIVVKVTSKLNRGRDEKNLMGLLARTASNGFSDRVAVPLDVKFYDDL